MGWSAAKAALQLRGGVQRRRQVLIRSSCCAYRRL
jgi:hypothetical protein